MSINRELAIAPISLIFGVLLMTLPGPPLDAADADPSNSKDKAKEALMLTDFAADSPDLGWYVQNDNVMGGRSEGGFETEAQGELIFAGSTNTNGGGFSSIRTQPFQLDISAYDGIQLRVKGDGRRYTWQLQTTALYRGYKVSYWAEFDTLEDEWSTVNIPFASFYPQFRGFKLEGPELDPSELTELGLYIYDKKDGAFKLRLDSVEAYSTGTP
jgi:NADH dehydrogenase [ubiquinone] 1 alpha subcomplex assembly factor 1